LVVHHLLLLHLGALVAQLLPQPSAVHLLLHFGEALLLPQPSEALHRLRSLLLLLGDLVALREEALEAPPSAHLLLREEQLLGSEVVEVVEVVVDSEVVVGLEVEVVVGSEEEAVDSEAAEVALEAVEVALEEEEDLEAVEEEALEAVEVVGFSGEEVEVVAG